LPLEFGYEFKPPLLGVNFSASLQTLMFGCFVKELLEGVNFPASLLTLAFGFEVNQPLWGWLSLLLCGRRCLEASSISRWRA
jgi:hypothetical protein